MTYLDKELFKRILQKAFAPYALSTVAFDALWNLIHCEGLKKNELFTVEGKKCIRLGFLVSGVVIGIGNDINGKRIVSELYNSTDNRVVTSFRSFDMQVNSLESIKALNLTPEGYKVECRLYFLELCG
jgi:hypothetical protein